MKVYWDIDRIRQVLPQEYPFLFVDRVISVDEQTKEMVCLKQVTFNEYYFKGHFPGNPVMPGVIMIEAFAQACILLYAALNPEHVAKNPEYYLGRVETRFRKVVKPGSQLILKMKGVKIVGSAGVVLGKALVDDEIIAEAKISFGVKLGNSKS